MSDECKHENTISGHEWTDLASGGECSDVVTCLDCDEVLVREPKGTAGSLLEQMRWLD